MENAIPKAVFACTLALAGLTTASRAAAQNTEILTATFKLWSGASDYVQGSGASGGTTLLTTDATWVDNRRGGMYLQTNGPGLLLAFRLRDASIKSAECTGTVPGANSFTTAVGPHAVTPPQIVLTREPGGGSNDNPIDVTCRVSR